MDQDAFRALLSAPSSSSSTSNNRRPIQPLRGSTRSVGLTKSKSQPDSNQDQKQSHDSLKPRKFKSKETQQNSKDGNEKGGYRDRASERRRGLDGDFAEAEHLLENFQARVAAAGDQIDKEILEEQTKYLGGDERHTILVKGLDHALLERRKAELAAGGKLGTVTDDDLDAAYEQNKRMENDSCSKANQTKPTPKNRAELLSLLKSSRGSSNTSADLAVVDRLKSAGKFKPIGLSVEDQRKEDERKAHKLRKAEKKKKRKLKKAAEEDQQKNRSTEPTVTLPGNSHEATSSSVEKPKAPTKDVQPSESIPTRPSVEVSVPLSISSALNLGEESTKCHSAALKVTNDDSDDMDIFGDAGEYKGIGDSSSSDDEETDERPIKVETSLNQIGKKKRKTYFEEDEESEGEMIKTKSDDYKEIKDEMKKEEVKKGEEEKKQEKMIRLEGLSGSSDIKMILSLDRIKDQEEKRNKNKKNKKSKKNQGSDDEVNNLNDHDRLNKEFLEMKNYLKNRK